MGLGSGSNPQPLLPGSTSCGHRLTRDELVQVHLLAVVFVHVQHEEAWGRSSASGFFFHWDPPNLTEKVTEARRVPGLSSLLSTCCVQARRASNKGSEGTQICDVYTLPWLTCALRRLPPAPPPPAALLNHFWALH